jgi:tRNA-2-methylthio-N6-dimethylallyladenosine synthase
MLKRMIRRYSIAEYEERVAALVREVPGVTLSTDVIVGFPGETREDFQETLGLVERIGFTGLFGFKYSPRPYTPALALDGEPSEDEKSARLAELFGLSERLRRAHLESLVGSRQEVLVEGRGRDGAFGGRSERNEIVHVPCELELTGEIVPVIVRRAFKNSLAAEVEPAWLAAARARRSVSGSTAARRALPIAP